MKRTCLCAFIGALIWLTPTAKAEDASKDAVTRHIQGFAITWNRHDLDAFEQLFAPDADFVNVTATWWRGRQAIEKNHAFTHGVIPATDTKGVTPPFTAYGIFK